MSLPSKSLIGRFTLGLLLISGLAFFMISRAGNNDGINFNPEFARYISGFTSGTISKESAIRIQFTRNLGDSLKDAKLEKLFSFSPAVSGTTRWLDESTLEFIPDKALKPGKSYEVEFNLGKLLMVPEHLEEFKFEFHVIGTAFSVNNLFLESSDSRNMKQMRAKGYMLCSDKEDPSLVEKCITAEQQGRTLQIKWEHLDDKVKHRFSIEGIERGSKSSEVEIKWNGKAIDADYEGSDKLYVPAIGEFKVIDVKMEPGDESYISVMFSDPISYQQDLRGLVELKSTTSNQAIGDLRFAAYHNQIRIYFAGEAGSNYLIQINPGLKNAAGHPFNTTYRGTITYGTLRPEVNFVGKGVIMPASSNLLIPFEAIALKAVDVTITRIFENNVAQFFQVNSYSTNYELQRVGRKVMKKKILLGKSNIIDLRKKHRFALKLDDIIQPEPGAIYQVKITFKRAYSILDCPTDEQENNSEEEGENPDDNAPMESSYWDMAEEFDYSNYDWEQRDNPCHPSYYTSQRWAEKNYFASNIGLLVRKGKNNDYLISCNDIRTAQPLPNVQVELINLQRQRLGIGKTNDNGETTIQSSGKGFLVIASLGTQKAYLKIDDGSALSLSHYDIAGEEIQKGLKGFIYAERGVWRPGDSIYINLILEDKYNQYTQTLPATLELLDPAGRVYKRFTKTAALNGFYDLRTKTDDEAITGNWTARVKVGAAVFSKQLKIETVVPNRLKIELDFPGKSLSADESIQFKLKSRWLHGATASGLRASVEMGLYQVATTFNQFPDFNFEDKTRRFNTETKTIFDGNLNGNGEANINYSLSLENNSAGLMNANFTTRVFEDGGGYSIDKYAVPFHRYQRYVGVRLPRGDKARGMLLTDTTHRATIVLVNRDGNLVKGAQTVKARLFKISWRWWWEKGPDDAFMYNDFEDRESLQEAEVTLINGKGNFPFRINYPEWGRYLIKIEDGEGHSTSSIFYCDWPGWAGRDQRDNPVEASMLSFNTDKKQYKVGDVCKLSIPGAKGGRALISVETGSKAVASYWISMKEGDNAFSFPVTKDMLPNAFVHITLLQPHAQVKNDLPIRLFGLVPIEVVDPQTLLKPVISCAEVFRPGQQSTIKVSEELGRAMTYTLAIVDEGLLDLTRYKTPDPHSRFFSREALGVKTWDMYDYVMGAFGMDVNRILSIGGDEGINRKAAQNKANRFKPVVEFIGPFHLEAGKSASHSIKIDNYIGSVKVMVVAGYKGAYGNAEKAVPVKSGVMVQAALPRVIAPGEEFRLPVQVFVNEGGINAVALQVSTNNLIELIGGNSKNINFSKPGEDMSFFKIKAGKQLGVAKIIVSASGNGQRISQEIELEIRNPNPYQTEVVERLLQGGEAAELSYKSKGMPGTKSAVLEISSIPAINLEQRLRYLIQYPHGCLEQTTSAAFGQLFVPQLADLNPGLLNQIDANVKAAISKLKSFQLGNGGFAYWPGETQIDNWATSYAGHFLLEAQNLGYTLPYDMIEKWSAYQNQLAEEWDKTSYTYSDLDQAYRLYTLALAGKANLSAMNKLRGDSKLTKQARYRLASAYYLQGQKATGDELINGLDAGIELYTELGYNFGSAERDKAMILETYLMAGQKQKAFPVMESLARELGKNNWMSTQTTAYSLMAIAKYSGRTRDGKGLDFTWTQDGKSIQEFTQKSMMSRKLKPDGNLSLRNNSKAMTYVRVVSRGQLDIGEEEAGERNLKMDIKYYTKTGEPIDIKNITQGTDFQVLVSITNPTDQLFDQMALTQVFPAGWEIRNPRMEELLSTFTKPRYQDIRDDRVMSYFAIPAGKTLLFKLDLHASYPGKYYLPASNCEAMYDGRIYSRTKGRWVEVNAR
ncbi:MAG: hypothetical protein LCH37_02820 [Bacteroidetes bacterium]|nr:hypothetical protein [Bacteroidota bacterium]